MKLKKKMDFRRKWRCNSKILQQLDVPQPKMEKQGRYCKNNWTKNERILPCTIELPISCWMSILFRLLNDVRSRLGTVSKERDHLLEQTEVMRSEIRKHLAIKQSTLDKMQRMKLELGLTSSESNHLIQVPNRSLTAMQLQ